MLNFLPFFIALFIIFASPQPSQAQSISQDFKSSQLTFDYLASDGSYWYDCKHTQGKEPHAWVVTCQNYIFHLHLLLFQYIRPNEATFELHYWADEVSLLKQSHTQSTWLTVDKEAKAKRIIAYLGFGDDTSQLRLGVELTKPPGKR
ncbi:MAG: hypothetical protein H7061_03900 [Bdellovibrionaceae bacterium]|nr:hypothetical protein [Bdellovibrio sp.]